MQRPNFFIPGSPRCGTTSMYAWLKQHPRIFMPQRYKEPHYFSSDMNSGPFDALTENEYKELFSEASSNVLAIGEASTDYLYSREAIPAIEKYCDCPKYVIMVRDPVDMAHSLHQRRIKDQKEDVSDFETAWRRSPERRRGEQAPPSAPEPKKLDYMRYCKHGTLLERMLEYVNRDRVHVVLLDDMKEEPGRTYRKVLDFLEVPDDGRTNFERTNRGEGVQSPLINSSMRYVRWLSRTLKSMIGIPPRSSLSGFIGTLSNWNTSPEVEREPISPPFREELIDFYRDDVRKLEDLIDRDLSHWLERD